eukprot:CAMPEP_0194289604 /NCGR_PEP_ID=MMETSP0169-20130528/39414_1 /TAXON_ID=218684 /ORGANISM="Corethron pennatum, Strain L29A3" /LENGTH=118 /DNA_ID=CAMNT_0039036929 /DNA_START=474 /DNA_END=830 /DNA_ORIENTATION=+
MGVREWPGVDRGKLWEDRASKRPGSNPTAVRYVLEGLGTVTNEATGEVFKVGPGTMVEVEDDGDLDGADLTWRLTGESNIGEDNLASGFLILSPTYENLDWLSKVALLLVLIAYVGLT